MRPDVSRPRLVVELALREFVHERVMSACFVLSLSAVLLPLLVLFGLKFGIIGNLLEPLKEDPRYRQILPAGSGSYGPDWFETMAARSDVAFIVPRTRAIAATMRLRSVESETGRIISAELIPSAPGDPTLGGLEPPRDYDKVVLSLDAADKLGVSEDDAVEGILTRTLRGEQQTVLVPLRVGGVAPAAAFARDGMFVSHELLMAVEDFKDGRAVEPLGWSGVAAPDGPRYFAGFRLYARSIDDVAALREALMHAGIDVRSRVADIELVHALDRNLSIVFWIIAGIAAAGYGLAFGSSVWANVDRKRLEFSVLRLTGFRTRAIVWFPIVQAGLTGALGWLFAVLAFFVVQVGLNTLFADTVGGGESVCRLLPGHFILALLLTLVAASVAAASGGRRLALLEPSLALREA
jgi:putative ABC transport system permease protein